MNTGYEKVFDELINELTQLEAKPFYDLFKKLYCSNYSLRNELEQVSRRYYKLHEIVNNKRQCVERLYELLQVLSKPEVKILSLLKEVENGNTVSLEHTVVGIITNYEYSVLEEICKEFDCLVEQIKNDNVKLIIGMTLGKAKAGKDEYAKENSDEWSRHKDIMVRCLEKTRHLRSCIGVSYFCYQYFYNSVTGAECEETREERSHLIPLLKEISW